MEAFFCQVDDPIFARVACGQHRGGEGKKKKAKVVGKLTLAGTARRQSIVAAAGQALQDYAHSLGQMGRANVCLNQGTHRFGRKAQGNAFTSTLLLLVYVLHFLFSFF